MSGMLALDRWSVAEAKRRAAAQPRCDLTIPQLPALSYVDPVDLVALYHFGDGETHKIPVSLLGAAQYAVRLRLSGSDYTPSTTGVDAGSVVVIPWSPADDTTSLLWSVTDIFARCESPGPTVSTTVRIEYSTSAGAFAPAGFVDFNGCVLAPGAYESPRPTTLSVPVLPSGWVIRSNITTLDTALAGLSVYVILMIKAT